MIIKLGACRQLFADGLLQCRHQYPTDSDIPCHDAPHMSDPIIAGAILAGGQARRFGGADKSRLLTADGRSIIVGLRDALQQVARHVCVVTTTSDQRVRPHRFDDLAIPVVTDVVDGTGALGGVHAAMTWAGQFDQVDRVLVVACDLPHLTPPLLAALASRACTGDGAWIRTARGPEPLIACYRCAALDRLTAALAAGERRASALGSIFALAELGPEELSAFGDPDRLAANVNTPDEWRRVQ